MRNVTYGCIFLLFMPVGMASIDAHDFPDDDMQLRHQALIAELRCPQCLNTNLAGSDAMIARDLRREVRRLCWMGNQMKKFYPLCMTGMAILCFIPPESILEPYSCGSAHYCSF